ncbi:unnamed protein product [Somion occarium]|uniref:BTB domain-containing protein n=1 Tax=Somion occarium TaxID=3059160 RepID=A0ABP1E6B1_9APHY
MDGGTEMSEHGDTLLTTRDERQELIEPLLTPISTPIQGEMADESLASSVSTAFSGSSGHDDGSPDLVFISADKVSFHTHYARVCNASSNNFNFLLPNSPEALTETGVFQLAEEAAVLNVIFHCIYKLPFEIYDPALSTLLSVVVALQKYGLSLQQYLIIGTPLYQQMSLKTASSPIDVYTVAASNDLFDLASVASSYLLSYPVDELSDEVSITMGPVYLRRLFSLHTQRLKALRALMASPPVEHPSTPACGEVEKKRLPRSWSLFCTSIAFYATPDMSSVKLRSVLETLGELMLCDVCKQSLLDRVQELVVQWSAIPMTILRDPLGYRAGT